MYILAHQRIGTLAHVHTAIHFRRHVDSHLYGRQLAAVQPGLGVAVYALGDRHSLVPPAHLYRWIAGSRLTRDRSLHAGFQVHRVVLDVQVIG